MVGFDDKDDGRNHFLMEFLERLKAKWEECGRWSSAEVARRAATLGYKIGTSAFSKYRNGTEPGIFAFMALCQVFRMTPNYALTGGDDIDRFWEMWDQHVNELKSRREESEVADARAHSGPSDKAQVGSDLHESLLDLFENASDETRSEIMRLLRLDVDSRAKKG
jgi:hypothetical protein